MPNPTLIVPSSQPAPDYRTSTWVQIKAAMATLDRTPYIQAAAPFSVQNTGIQLGKSMVFMPFTLPQDATIRYRLAVGAAQTDNPDQYAVLWLPDPASGKVYRRKAAPGSVTVDEVFAAAGQNCFVFGSGWAGPGHRFIGATDAGGGKARLQTAAAHGLSGGETIVISQTSPALYRGQYTTTADDATHFRIPYDTTFPGTVTGGYWRLGDNAAQLQLHFACAVRYGLPASGIAPWHRLPAYAQNGVVSPFDPPAIVYPAWPASPVFALADAAGTNIVVVGGGGLNVNADFFQH